MNLNEVKKKAKRGRPPKRKDEPLTLNTRENPPDPIPTSQIKDIDQLSNLAAQDPRILANINHNFRYNSLPHRYRYAYLQTETSQNYLSLRSDIAFTVAVLTDLIKNLDDPILSEDLIQMIHNLAIEAEQVDAHRQPNRANSILKKTRSIVNLTNKIDQQHSHLKEIRIMQKHLVLLVETERKRLEAGHNAMSIEDVFSIIQNTTKSIKRNAQNFIEDPQQRQQFLEAIANDQDRELSLLGYAKTPLPEFTDPIQTTPEPTIPNPNQLQFSNEPLDALDIRAPDILQHTRSVIEDCLDE